MWAKWVLSLSVAALLLLGLVLFVDHNSNYGAEAPQSPQAVVRANREADVVVAQDEAPHVVRLRPGTAPRAAMLRSVRGAMTRLINGGIIDGTLQRTSCARAGGTAARPAFSCTAVAGSVNYRFLGAVDLGTRTLTYCKRDEPPVPSQNVPVSPRCTA